ncbi:MAG: tRNA pseudouridine synthase [Candidatus Angelobacter sp.]|nr:tRNA pseudouridine synthase [Candidatus Angelobacter sp.]
MLGNPCLARNLKLTLAYDGHDFAGWQVQPDRATIQGTLVSVIEQLTGEKTLPQGSGRTDAGVHALAQTATVTLESPIPAANFGRALNDVLPRAIRVLAVEEMPPHFHARRSAVAKTYRYRIFRGDICSPFLARYVYHHPYPLDESRMVEAAALVEGEHDFTSFAAVDPEKRKEGLETSKERLEPASAGFETNKARLETNEGLELKKVRTIFQSQWQRDADELIYTVRGNGFLHHMVRNLVGTFLTVGKGSLPVADVRRILELRDRSAAAATAPASGLFLVNVEY